MKLKSLPELEESGYKVLDYIGHGGFGEVFLVKKGSGEKRVLKEYYEKLGGLGFVEKAIEVRRSAVGIAPEDVVMPESGQYFGKQLKVVMNHVDGQSYDEILSNFKKKAGDCILPEFEFPFLSSRGEQDEAAKGGVKLVQQYVSEAAAKIQLLMDNGLVHGDIKPENVMMRRQGGSTLIDFDFMLRRCEPLNDNSSLVWGLNSPPEVVVAASNWLPRTYDIYSLGMSAMMGLFGKPFLQKLDSTLRIDAKEEKLLCDFMNRLYEIPLTESPIISARIRRDLVDKLPDYLRWDVHGLVEFGIAALSRDPKARPKSADEVRQLLEMRPSVDPTVVNPSLFFKFAE